MAIHLILGTAGHIDHGKTALVRALTGVDTDRLPEAGEPDFLIRMRLKAGHLMFRTSIPFVFDMAAVVPCPSRSKPCLI